MNNRKYRADIDGLRALAVISVILFHYGFDTFAGGFVGVDVFFVISGFLITRIIRDDIIDKRFSFSSFYMRRARRLFPAVFFTTVACFIAGYFLFSPQHLERFGGSIVHSLLGASNFFFWSESGYFDTESINKPLLHTWSLSVEEQFYLIWPAFIVLMHKAGNRFVPPSVILLIGGISLVITEIWLGFDEEGAFFLLPSRIVEFAMGAMVVWIYKYQPRNKLLLEPLVWIGLALIAYPVLTYDSYTRFPGLRALVPCLGTAILIYSGQARFSGRILSNGLLYRLGLISYSLYLIHWPFLVFYSYYKLDELNLPEKIILMAASLVSSILMYVFVETPVRRGIRKKNHLRAPAFGFVCAMLTLMVCFAAAHAWAGKGWSWRLSDEIKGISENMEGKKLESWKYARGNGAPGQKAFRPRLTNVLITGDSHGKDLFNALYLNRSLYRKMEFRFFGLDDECFYLFKQKKPAVRMKASKKRRCESDVRKFKKSPLMKKADFIIVSSRWKKSSIPFIDDYYAFLKRRNKKIKLAITGRTPEFSNIPQLVVRYGRLNGIEKYVASTRKKYIDTINKKLSLAAGRLEIPFRNKLSVVCSRDGDSCDVLDSRNNILFYDYGHWTLEGAKHFGRKMHSQGFLKDLLEVL